MSGTAATRSVKGKGTDEVDGGINALSQQEWYDLQAFVLFSKNWNPTTVEKMAVAVKIERPANAKTWDPTKDPHWDADFTKTTKHFADLAAYCDDSDLSVTPKVGFWNVIKPGVVELANDIVQYQMKMNSFYGRLIKAIDKYDDKGLTGQLQAQLAELKKDLNLAQPSEGAQTVKKDFIKAFTRLHEDADGRKKAADKLKTLLGTFHTNLIASQGEFGKDTENYNAKYGTQSQAAKDLQKKIDGLNDELKNYRQKEKDEVIVLGSSPVYLVLWPFGPLIMAGVQIGVGVDLAKTRAKIDKLVGDVNEYQKKLDTNLRFKTAYDTVKNETDRTVKAIQKVLPAVAKLVDGWGMIVNDLAAIVKSLNAAGTDANKDDWWTAATELQTAQDTWVTLKEKANGFSKNATIKEVPSVDQFVQELAKSQKQSA
jgi:hypothetical protein